MFNPFTTDNHSSLKKELMKEKINEKKVQKLIDDGVNINETDLKGRTLLFELVQKRKIEAIKILLKNGANINHEDKLEKTPLFIAALNADNMMIKFLLDNKASINHINFSGGTLIQDIALDGNLKVFQLLLDNGADLEHKDIYGKHVLFKAIEGQNLEIVKKVLININDINVIDNEGQNALFYAAFENDQSIMKHLIEYGLDVNHLDNKKRNVLFDVIINGSTNLDILDALFAKNININQQMIDGKTILGEIITIFNISRQTDTVEHQQTNYKYIKKENNYPKLLSILVKKGLRIDKKDESGKSILFHAVHKKDFEQIELLLNAGANINTQNKFGKTILFQECLKGYENYEMISYLLQKGLNIDHVDLSEKTIIDDLVEIILLQDNHLKIKPKIPYKIIQNGDYLLLLKRLLDKCSKFNYVRKNERTILFDIINNDNKELIKLFINSNLDLNKVDNEGNTPFSYMIEEGLKIKSYENRQKFLERVEFILKFRVDVNIIDKNRQTVFHKAVIADDYELIEKLLSKKCDLHIKDKYGRTPLHHTVWKGNYKIARLLIASGSNINEVDFSGFTILNYAAILGHIKLVTALISSGAFMYNKTKKSKSVAMFFKKKENSLSRLLENNIADIKMQKVLQEVIDNLKNEIFDALK